jgi:hypothetical protein
MVNGRRSVLKHFWREAAVQRAAVSRATRADRPDRKESQSWHAGDGFNLFS